MRRIPVVAGTTLDLLEAGLPAARALLAEARRRYSAFGVAAADRVSRLWLARTGNPYLPEIDRLAGRVGEPGLTMLNISYEWGCTSGVAPAPDGDGSRLLRTLDWPFDGLGRSVAVLDTKGPAGRYFSITWPGFAGVLTAMAPQRFSVAINQAKGFHGRVAQVLEWPLNRARFLSSRALPPAHLLRAVCETAPDYAIAVRLLCDTPVALPVFFTVSGIHPGEGCVVEREPTRAHLHAGPAACANHWRFPGVKGTASTLAARVDSATPFGKSSVARHDIMLSKLAHAADGFGWLGTPVLNPDTRLACVMNAAQGRMAVVGIEAMRAATEILEIVA